MKDTQEIKYCIISQLQCNSYILFRITFIIIERIICLRYLRTKDKLFSYKIAKYKVSLINK